MKKILLAIIFSFAVFLSSHGAAFATAALPTNSIWVSPATAAEGAAITLNALVYNNTAQDVTVTVTFTTKPADPAVQPKVLGTIKQLVTSESAKTFSQAWTMPKGAIAVTGAVTSALTKQNQSIQTLVGPLGTITVGSDAVTPVATGVTFPGSVQLSNWFGPFITKVEAWRTKEATYYTALRDKTKTQLDITKSAATTTPVSVDGLPPVKTDNPMQWVTLIFATACASLFSNMVIFYISAILLILLVLRFIINLVF